jgi:hypothetical protein
MNIEQASFLGLVGSGLSIAAFCSLTLLGILFVRVLDFIEGHCIRMAGRYGTAQAVVVRSEHPASQVSRPPETSR